MSKFLLALIILFVKVKAKIIITDSGNHPVERDSAAILFYVDILNNDSEKTCKVRTWSKKCCLDNIFEKDCNVMHAYGSRANIKPKDKQTLIYVLPSVHQHDLVGDCDFALDYLCGRYVGRQQFNISFDTRVHKNKKRTNLLTYYMPEHKADSCETLDQNTFNNCEPVDCDMKYLGEKPYYDDNRNICVRAPVCEADPKRELPNIVYLPSINSCRDLEHSLTMADVYAISTGLGIVTRPSRLGNEMVMQSDCSTISQNLKILEDLMSGKICPQSKGNTQDCNRYHNIIIFYLTAYIMGIIVALLSFVCCIYTTVWVSENCSHVSMRVLWQESKENQKIPNGEHMKQSKVDSGVKNALMHEVITRNMSMELRDSSVNVCEGLEKEVKWKKKRSRKYTDTKSGSKCTTCK